MKNILFTLAILLSFSSLGQNHPATPATESIKKKCEELNAWKVPSLLEKGLMIDKMTCSDGSIMYELRYLERDAKIDGLETIEMLKNAHHQYRSQPSLNTAYFDDFKKAKWQIVFDISDRNDKFYFILVYDVGENGEYTRNLYVEKMLKNMTLSAEKIIDGINKS